MCLVAGFGCGFDSHLSLYVCTIDDNNDEDDVDDGEHDEYRHESSDEAHDDNDDNSDVKTTVGLSTM